MAIGAAEHQPGLAAGDAKHFMSFGMVVVITVNPVAPLWRPAISAEDFLERCCCVAVLHGNDLRVNEYRQTRIIGYPFVAFKP